MIPLMEEQGGQRGSGTTLAPWLIPTGMVLAIVLVALASLWSVLAARRQAMVRCKDDHLRLLELRRLRAKDLAQLQGQPLQPAERALRLGLVVKPVPQTLGK